VPYDCALLRPIGANGCCRVVLDTNRYTVERQLKSMADDN
jgi:hypothetical protein